MKLEQQALVPLAAVPTVLNETQRHSVGVALFVGPSGPELQIADPLAVAPIRLSAMQARMLCAVLTAAARELDTLGLIASKEAP